MLVFMASIEKLFYCGAATEELQQKSCLIQQHSCPFTSSTDAPQQKSAVEEQQKKTVHNFAILLRRPQAAAPVAATVRILLQQERFYTTRKKSFSLFLSSRGVLEVELQTDNTLPSVSVDQIPLGEIYLYGTIRTCYLYKVYRRVLNAVHESCPQRPTKNCNL